MTAFSSITGTALMQLHDQYLAQEGWPAQIELQVYGDGDDPWPWIRVNHFHNASLWVQEDLARRTQVSDSEIAANKRAIDRHNQKRNDAVERIDELLLITLGVVNRHAEGRLQPLRVGARLNSETAGAMIDRLSILSLKCHAMRGQLMRTDVGAEHLAISHTRLLALQEQRADLLCCLDTLLNDTRCGTAWFKVYRQFKMYNDPEFNPALVAERRLE